MQGNGSSAKTLRVLTDVFIADEGPSGLAAVAPSAPATSIGSAYEQAVGTPSELYFRSILHALQLGKELNVESISVLCPDEVTVKLVNRELLLEPGSRLAPLYMRVRALMYTYRRAEIRRVPRGRVRPARNLAIAASRMPVRPSNPQRELFAVA